MKGYLFHLPFILCAFVIATSESLAREAAFMQPSPPISSSVPAPPQISPQSPSPSVAAPQPLDVAPVSLPPSVSPTPVVDKTSTVEAPALLSPQPVVQTPVVEQKPSLSAVSEIHVVIDTVPDIDVGDSPVNTTKHAIVSFFNHGNVAVPIDKIALTPHGHVGYTISHDSCSKKTLSLSGQCDVDLELVVHSAGLWSLDVALSPFASPPAAHARITGQSPEAGTISSTAIKTASEQKEGGATLSLKNMTTVEFDKVDVGSGKTVRSALMVNEGPEALTLQSIEVVAVDKSLLRLPQGCSVNMKLKAGESCPIVLAWKPTKVGQLSTDLIIRYTGRPGFVVIPIRGVSQGKDQIPETKNTEISSQSTENAQITHQDVSKENTIKQKKKPHSLKGHNLAVVTPDLQKVVSALPNISAKSSGGSHQATLPPGLHLIGIVGTRAILQKPNETTVVVNAGDAVDLGTKQIKVIDVHPQSIDILLDDQTMTLILKSSSEQGHKASESNHQSSDSTEAEPSQSFLSLPASLAMPLPLTSSR